jgi:hypothetical protein
MKRDRWRWRWRRGMRGININEVDIDLKGQRTLRVCASMFETHSDIDPEAMEGGYRRKRCRRRKRSKKDR